MAKSESNKSDQPTPKAKVSDHFSTSADALESALESVKESITKAKSLEFDDQSSLTPAKAEVKSLNRQISKVSLAVKELSLTLDIAQSKLSNLR